MTSTSPLPCCPPLHDDLGIVADVALEQQLELVRSSAASPLAGVFGPTSITWGINREAVVFLAAGRALLLQIAHPWVAAAVADHSRALVEPISRFHRTFSTVFALVFGSVDQAFAAARRLHCRHSQITGVLPTAIGPFKAGSPYYANNIFALQWVYATLIESAGRQQRATHRPAPRRSVSADRGRRDPSSRLACRLEHCRVGWNC
jgi:uncharacterized protein (DUF2236 family)